MIRHVVMWKFREGTEKEAEHFLVEVQKLYGVIPELKGCKAAKSIGNDNYDAILLADFENMQGLAAYMVDPRHVAVSKLCMAIRTDRVAVDYEL